MQISQNVLGWTVLVLGTASTVFGIIILSHSSLDFEFEKFRVKETESNLVTVTPTGVDSGEQRVTVEGHLRSDDVFILNIVGLIVGAVIAIAGAYLIWGNVACTKSEAA
ncbi:MAG: hypothetical protein H6850_02115 [Alphaproteobacteria bacterium]|nr:MAG: hypothetical protein H6850_02115 [Alphaproteobacteria bacterium]